MNNDRRLTEWQRAHIAAAITELAEEVKHFRDLKSQYPVSEADAQAVEEEYEWLVENIWGLEDLDFITPAERREYLNQIELAHDGKQKP